MRTGVVQLSADVHYMRAGVVQLSADVHLLIAQYHQQHILLKNLYFYIRLSPSISSLSSIVTFMLRVYHKLSEH